LARARRFLRQSNPTTPQIFSVHLAAIIGPMAPVGTILLLFCTLPSGWGAAVTDPTGTSCDTNAAGCVGDLSSLVQTKLSLSTLSAKGLNRMARSIKSESDQLAMLKYGESLLQKLRVETGNGTKHLKDDEEKLLESVIKLIETSMYGSMQDAHKANQFSLDKKVNDTNDCNEELTSSLEGEVSDAEGTTNTSRDVHTSCRDGEATLYDSMHDSEAALNTTMQHIPTPPTVPSFPAGSNRTLASVTIYFEAASPYIDWYRTNKVKFNTARSLWETSTGNHSSQHTTCNAGQAHFEEQYLLWKEKLEGTCERYCHDNKTSEYEALKEQFIPLVENRKDAFRAGEVLVSKIKCLLATGNCNTTTVDTTQWELIPKTPAARLDCSTSDVEHGICSAEFYAEEYSNLPDDAPAVKAAGCPA